MFWNVDAPKFEILFSPQPVLVTDVKDTVFSLVNMNFDVSNFTDYEVTWSIEPDLPQMNMKTLLRSGTVF
jgi:hypothetical protein